MYSYLSFDWKANSSMVRIKVPSDLSSNPTSGDFSDEGAVGKIPNNLTYIFPFNFFIFNEDIPPKISPNTS